MFEKKYLGTSRHTQRNSGRNMFDSTRKRLRSSNFAESENCDEVEIAGNFVFHARKNLFLPKNVYNANNCACCTLYVDLKTFFVFF